MAIYQIMSKTVWLYFEYAQQLTANCKITNRSLKLKDANMLQRCTLHSLLLTVQDDQMS